jgi:hypothetical protein
VRERRGEESAHGMLPQIRRHQADAQRSLGGRDVVEGGVGGDPALDPGRCGERISQRDVGGPIDVVRQQLEASLEVRHLRSMLPGCPQRRDGLFGTAGLAQQVAKRGMILRALR